MPDWRRNLLILTGSMFFIMVGWTCFLPFIPHFIQDELGVTSLAAAEVWTGIVIALGPMTIALSSPFWGGVADRRGHKRIVVQSVIGLGVATALMSVSTNVWQLAAIRAFSGFFSGFLPAAIGFVGANFPQAVLGYALGIVQMGQMTGSILGPVAGGWIVHYFGYRGAFVAGSALCLITLPAILFGVKESSRRLAPSVRRFELRDAVTLARRERPFLAILLSLFTAQLALRGLEPLTPLYVEQLAGGGERATVLAGLVYGAAGVGTLVASPLLGWYGDRRGHRLVLEASLLVACVSSLAQYFAGDPWTLAVWRVVLGIGIGGILPSTNAIAGGLAPEAGKGSVYGLLSFATFLGNAIGPVAGTVVAAAVGIRFIFAAAAGLLLVNAAWVTWVLGAAVRRTGHPAHHAC